MADKKKDGKKTMSQTMMSAMNAAAPRRESYDEVIRNATRDYINNLDPDNPPDPSEVESRLSEAVFRAINLRNTAALKEDRWPVPRHLEAAQIADLLIWARTFARIDFSDGVNTDTSAMPLHVYDEESGLYVEVDHDIMSELVHAYSYSASGRTVDEVMAIIRSKSPVRVRTRSEYLDVCANGIHDRRSGRLLPFSPKLVFTTKTSVDWVDAPPLPVITAPDGYRWDPETAMLEWAGGRKDICDLLWRVVAMMCRPNVRWNQSVWFYSQSGNNGKGTICQLIRNLLGPGNYTSIPFADFNNNHFMLTSLPYVQAVICDENQVGKYADDNAEFKAAITNDAFQIDRKHKPGVNAKFYGGILQCVNEVPRIRDRSESFWRRIVVIDFKQCFTGRERSYIKQDFIARREVLEYVQWRALSIDCNSLEPPEDCTLMLEQFKQESSPVLQFATEVLPQLSWTGVPWDLLWAMFTSWYTEAYNRQSSGYGRNNFYNELGNIVDSHPELGWWYDHTPKNPRGTLWQSATHMIGPEPLIDRFGLADRTGPWGNAHYGGADIAKRSTPSNLNKRYRGLRRIGDDDDGPAPDDDDIIVVDAVDADDAGDEDTVVAADDGDDAAIDVIPAGATLLELDFKADEGVDDIVEDIVESLLADDDDDDGDDDGDDDDDDDGGGWADGPFGPIEFDGDDMTGGDDCDVG